VDGQQDRIRLFENVEQWSDLANALTRQAIELPDHHSVDGASTDILEERLIPRTAGGAPVARL